MEFDTASEQSNDLLIEAIKNGVKLLGSRPEFRSFVAEPERSLILDALQPVKSGNRIAISLDSITGNVERLSSVLVPQLLKVRESARVQQDMNNLRQLVLGLLNYESAFDKFPRADGKTEKNPAGLSWRVQILPFIEQGALYKQFKLDEPWDSKNNLPLVKKMPLIYQSPLRPARKANRDGRTVYQVPTCADSIFQRDGDTAEFFDMIDGTSNTIMLVSVAPDEAVIWTKPDDWDVDLDNSLEGLKGDQREQVSVALADGSVHRMSVTIDPQILRLLITKSGREVVPEKAFGN